MDVLTKARELRGNSTDAEILLWQKLRNRQLAGYKFKRQMPISFYIVDFVCFSAKLVVEVDGGQHADNYRYDQNRSKEMALEGYKVIRFWNNEVLQNIEGVLSTLTLTLSQRERELEKMK